MNPAPLSRRRFLKLTCLGTTAVGLTICGVGLAVPAPKEAPIDLPTQQFEGLPSSKRILLAYASACGSTAEIAQAITNTLVERGFSVDMRPVQDKPSAAGYDAVLVGSAVQYGKWLPEGMAFLQANQAALADIPVGLFCVHITNVDDSEASRQNREGYLAEPRKLVRPASEAFFAGKFDRRGAAMLLPGLVARIMPTWDLRNWDKIQSWAQSVFDFSSAQPAVPPINLR